MDRESIKIYYINGLFLIFNQQDAIRLRSKRIIWQLVGSTQLGYNLPCSISHYAAKICLENDFVQFVQLKEAGQTESNSQIWDSRLQDIKSTAHENFITSRRDELFKRGIEPTDKRIGSFDEANIRIPVQLEPSDDKLYKTTLIKSHMLEQIFDIDVDRMLVYRDLFGRGFYITSGLKFGGDYLAYQGDPVLYHATFVVKVLPGIDGAIDLERTNHMELNTILRLCHGSNKIPLYTVISHSGGEAPTINYWTLKTKSCIDIDKSTDCFDSIDPDSTKRYICCEDSHLSTDSQSKRIRLDV